MFKHISQPVETFHIQTTCSKIVMPGISMLLSNQGLVSIICVRQSNSPQSVSTTFLMANIKFLTERVYGRKGLFGLSRVHCGRESMAAGMA